MPLGMQNDIIAGDIAGLALLKSHKIWRLKGFVGDSLVLKYEQIANEQVLKNASPVLKTIDPLARMKALKPSEVGQVRIALAQQYNLRLDTHTNDFRTEMLDFLKIIDQRPRMYTLSKMANQTVLELDAALNQQAAGNGDAIIQFTRSLLAKDGLEKLGMVVAGDLVTGNQDRFTFNTGINNRKVGNHTYQLKCIYNLTNIILSGQNDRLEPSMLDYVDPGNGLREGMLTVEQMERNTGNKWQGRLLLKKKDRKSIASDVVSDLETLLTPPTTRRKLFGVLGLSAESRVLAGLETGLTKILRMLYVRSRTDGKRMTKSLASVLEILQTGDIKL